MNIKYTLITLITLLLLTPTACKKNEPKKTPEHNITEQQSPAQEIPSTDSTRNIPAPKIQKITADTQIIEQDKNDTTQSPDIPTQHDEKQTISQLNKLITDWNNARNDKDAGTLSRLFTENAYTHGKPFSRDELEKYIADAFNKHRDYKQKITSQPQFQKIDDKQYAIRLRKNFTQSAKTINTEVLLVVENINGAWLIVNESDDSMDRNIQKRLGIEPPDTNPKNCNQALRLALTTSPQFRHFIMQSYPAAKKFNVRFQIDITEEQPNFDSINLVEIHTEENARTRNAAKYAFNRTTQTLSIYDPVTDTDSSLPINTELLPTLQKWCPPTNHEQ